MSTSINSGAWKSKDYLKRFGVWPTLCRLAYRMQYPVLGYTRYLCLALPADACAAAPPPLPEGFLCREVDLAELEPFVCVPESNVRRKDLDRARVESHRCIGIFEGEKLASFSLNAPAPTSLGASFRFEFPEGWVYHLWRSRFRSGAAGGCTQCRFPQSSNACPARAFRASSPWSQALTTYRSRRFAGWAFSPCAASPSSDALAGRSRSPAGQAAILPWRDMYTYLRREPCPTRNPNP